MRMHLTDRPVAEVVADVLLVAAGVGGEGR